jgi:hypothetical protein
MKSIQDIVERAEVLKKMASGGDRERIRAVMNGGALGVQAVLKYGGPGTPVQQSGAGTGQGSDSGLGVDLPTANIMYSSLERLAQRIGRAPSLKTDMIPTKDTDPARKRAEKRGRIVTGWDDITRMEMQYPQIGRWLPGYGFTFHAIRERTFGDTTYPVAELRDPYDVYPGMWGVDQQPSEVAVYRHLSYKELKYAYPEQAELMDTKRAKTTKGAGVPIIGQSGSWEGNPNNPVTVIEYFCNDGTYVVCPELSAMLGFVPNPLTSGPAFVVTKRFSFDQLQSQFHHVFGLMAMMAKLNILGLIGVEDSTFRETNIIGEMVGDTYERGRLAVNEFEPGTRIEKPTSDQLQQTWQAINILERQFRVVAGYDVAQDGQSPNSFATGEGIKELGSSADLNVKENQTAIRHSIELADRKRLEWEQVLHASEKKKVFWFEGSKANEETYIPSKDIAGDYRTNREYGAMATFDENSKIVAGLQLLQARIIDRRTLQDNLDGLKNTSLINERIDEDQAKEMLIGALGQRSAEKDPAATMALVEIMDSGRQAKDTLKKLFTPQEPQMSPEEEQMMAMAGGGMPGGGPEGVEGGPPPAVQTILSQMETEGGGAMSVGRMG